MIQWLGQALGIIDKSMNLADQAIEDKDKTNELVANLMRLREVVSYVQELQTKTVPWLDGLHKMGRQILNLITIIGVFIAIYLGHEFTQWEVLILGGPNIAYQIIKGKGK